MDEAVGGEEVAAEEVEGVAVDVGDLAAGFGEDEGAGGDVPGFEGEFEEAVEAAGGCVA